MDVLVDNCPYPFYDCKITNRIDSFKNFIKKYMADFVIVII